MEQAGLLAFCRNWGASQGTFADKGELLRKIAEQKICKECGFGFRFGRDEEIYNLWWEIIPSREEYIIKLLEKEIKEEHQIIFCYEDLGPGSTKHIYPQKRIKFHIYEKTERASPAYAMNAHEKESDKLEKSYCFDSPYALLQVAKESIKGFYWLKHGKR